MKINSFTQTKTYRPNAPAKPAFKSQYEINGTSITSRQQVFTMGMLMSNFWIYDARNTFFDVKRRNVMGNFTIKVNDMRDPIVERILTNNRIEFKKIEKKY